MVVVQVGVRVLRVIFYILLLYYIVAAINEINVFRRSYKIKIKLKEPPTSRDDSLVVVEARWKPREPSTSRDDLLLVVKG